MEPTMISLKVLSTAAVMALVLPMVAPTASFAQNPNGTKFSYAGRPAGAVAPAARFGGGGGGGGGFRPGGGGGAPVAQFNGGGGGGYRGGYGGGRGGYGGGYGGGYHRHGGGGFIPGAVAGAVIGGAIASQSYGYAPGYYAPGYYDDQYSDDDGVVAVAPAPVGGDDVAYCMQTYRSYDPRSGTYLGYDGYRHPCP
jgi:hypothetical protein